MLHRTFAWSGPRARQATAAIQRFADLVRPRETVTVTAEDDPDNRILECALAADAQCIVTGDQHLRALGTFRGIVALSPRAFLEGLPPAPGRG